MSRPEHPVIPIPYGVYKVMKAKSDQLQREFTRRGAPESPVSAPESPVSAPESPVSAPESPAATPLLGPFVRIVDDEETIIHVKFAGGPLAGKTLEFRKADLPKSIDVMTRAVHDVKIGDVLFPVESKSRMAYKYDAGREVFLPEGVTTTTPVLVADPTPPNPVDDPNRPEDVFSDIPDGVQIHRASTESNVTPQNVGGYKVEDVLKEASLDVNASFDSIMRK